MFLNRSHTLFYVVLVLLFASCVEHKNYIGKDPRNFRETIAYGLVKAVMDEEEESIVNEVSDKQVPIDFQEPHYGLTALHLAVLNNKIESVRVLLKLGADPNIASDSINSDGGNAVIYAAQFQYIDCKILELLLEYKGNPNSINKGVTSLGNNTHYPLRMSALSYASNISKQKVELLVSYGADVNYKYTDDNALSVCPLENAIILGEMDIVLFLLEHGANYDIDFSSKVERTRIGSVDILYRLRQCMFKIGSDEHKTKMRIVEFLRSRGLDYFKSEIPEYISNRIKQQYPNTWKEYMEVY